jgi:hypothetical protein
MNEFLVFVPLAALVFGVAAYLALSARPKDKRKHHLSLFRH